MKKSSSIKIMIFSNISSKQKRFHKKAAQIIPRELLQEIKSTSKNSKITFKTHKHDDNRRLKVKFKIKEFVTNNFLC